MYEAFSPAHAWSAYQLVAEGLHFRGTPDNITVATAEEVAEKVGSAQTTTKRLTRSSRSMPGARRSARPL